ncbi:MAG TPA: S-layer homology domain-containing protein, partial [Vicinamibacteria bacterium]|nr:S-layer homology domain-containing protein [Vicinamibacteria bacterium]
WVLLLAALLAASRAEAQQPCQFWVQTPPIGNDNNPGTSVLPWATLDNASARILALGASGATVCFRDGVYTGSNSLYERFTGLTTFRAENPYRAVLQSSARAVQLFGARNMVFEGFEFRHTGAGAQPLVVQVQQDPGTSLWAENIVFRNNVFHDSWNNDILKINNGARFVRVEGNVFYNQGPGTISGDEHIDVNSVTDVTIEDNVFFNDFPGSGRPNLNDTSSFIVIKDSNAGDDGLVGSFRIAVRRNVFLNWQGSPGSNFVLVGEDGQPFHEAQDVIVENNLMLGNAPADLRSPFGVKGGRLVAFRHNTVVGDLPSCAYAMRLNQEGSNPQNDGIRFHNNIWSDPTGTMGAGCGGGDDFSDGAASESVNVLLDRNLYWNGADAIPPGDVLSPLVHDARRIVGDPQLNANQAGIVLPRWTGTGFPSGSTRIRQEFERLVSLYGTRPAGAPGLDQADTNQAPPDDVLGRPRGLSPDLGAWERVFLTGVQVTPTSGPTGGGDRLTLTEGPYVAGATVHLGGQPALDVWWGGPGFLKATTPALPPAALYDLTVTNPGGGTLTRVGGYMVDFLDVPRGHVFQRFVERVFRRGVTAGCGGGNYCPDHAVTREQMAVFLLRALEGPAYLPPPCITPTYADVPCSSPYARWIEELVRRSVTGGCSATDYCPTSPVTREQMAVFLLRTRFGPSYLPSSCVTPTFTDVPCSSLYARWIYDLVARGITGGCGAGAYCPTLSVTRGQMSAFLAATFGF